MTEMNDDNEQTNIKLEAGMANDLEWAWVAKIDAGLAGNVEWACALIALQYRELPDSKPLAALLRSGKPIPQGVRDSFAEMLDPGDLLTPTWSSSL